MINDDPSRLFGLWPMRGRRGNVNRDVRWRDGGWERLKGRGRKEVHFWRMGGLEKTEGTITPMFKRLPPPDTSHRQQFKVRQFRREWCFVALSPQAQTFSLKHSPNMTFFCLLSLFLAYFQQGTFPNTPRVLPLIPFTFPCKDKP